MELKQVNGLNEDFYNLCSKLENFQYNLLPDLKNKGYNLTSNLENITGFVLYINNAPVGSIGLKKVDNETCEIVRVFVCEDHRGNGYAKLLFNKIENLAKSLGYKKAEMVAWCKACSAIKLYKKLGYICSEEKSSEWFGGLKYVELNKTL